MTWVRVDENLPYHPKFTAISPAAAWLYVCGLAYCNRFLTDGLIPSASLVVIAPTIRAPMKYVEQLVSARLWESDEGGWRVHDFLHYQPTREEVKEERQRQHERAVAGGKARASIASRVAGRFTSQPPAMRVDQPTSTVPIRSDPILETTTALSGRSPTAQGTNGAHAPNELREHARHILAFLNEKTGRVFRPVDTNLRPIEARLRSGVSVQDVKSVIAMKCREWLPDPERVQYLRPETLFRASKFESYLGQLRKEPGDGVS